MSAHSALGAWFERRGQSLNAFPLLSRSVAQGSRVKCVGPLPSSSFPDRRHTLASSPRLVGIASAGFPPPASLLPAVLPADHPEPPWRVSLSHRRRLAGLFSTVLSSRLRSVKTHADEAIARSEEHTSELQSLMRISYALLCLKKKI